MNSNNKLTIVQHFQLKGHFQPFKRIDLFSYNITNMGVQGYISHYKCIEAYHNIKFKRFNTQWRIQGVKGVFSPPPSIRRIFPLFYTVFIQLLYFCPPPKKKNK